MANEIGTLDSLRKEAVRVYSGMTVVFPHFSKEETLNISGITPRYNGCYAIKDSTLCFVVENEVYAIPYTIQALRVLRIEGFKQEYFYVPFSNWEYPKEDKIKWSKLREKAAKSYEEEFREVCVEYCKRRGIGTLEDEVLKKCFEMPENGVRVRNRYFETKYYPILQSNSFDCSIVDKIGHFCINKGKVVFVYQNGKTYVAKEGRIVEELIKAGYTQAGIFVPFSNEEEILDIDMKARWESITK